MVLSEKSALIPSASEVITLLVNLFGFEVLVWNTLSLKCLGRVTLGANVSNIEINDKLKLSDTTANVY